MELRALIGKVAYGTLFVMLLPGLLWYVACQLDRTSWASWPVPLNSGFGLVLAGCGLALMAQSMLLLWTDGKGLPMNAYPTTQWVSRSAYSVIAHPIYAGFVLCILGLSGWAQSPAGFWLIAPLGVLAAVALVVGYEGPALRRRFGRPLDAPLLGLPLARSTPPKWPRALGALASSLGPWTFLYWALSHTPTPAQAFDMRMQWELPVTPPSWAVWVYTALYPIVIAMPLVLQTEARLRRWVISSWVCTSLGFLLMLGFPNFASAIVQPHSAIEAWVLLQNRSFDAEWMAAPSFHAAWAVVSAGALADQWPRKRFVAFVVAALVGASCVLTGSHAVWDVVLGVLLGLVSWNHANVWSLCTRLVERLGNSCSSTRVGPARVINHAVWSFLAAFVGICSVLWLLGSAAILPTVFVVSSGLVGAGAWGYWIEGGSRLSRPFGYYGFLFGSFFALGLLGARFGASIGMLVAALATAAPITQALGRLRCVVQGCCHGRPVLSAQGIRIRNPMSRIVSLAKLGGQSIHPTPLYSIVANVALAVILFRLWSSNAPWTLIAGLYLCLSSLARFVEEQFRGEPQTPLKASLPIYQWLAAALFAVGLVLMGLPGAAVQSAHALAATAAGAAFLMGLVAAFLMSVDFPNSKRAFSQLTVNSPARPDE